MVKTLLFKFKLSGRATCMNDPTSHFARNFEGFGKKFHVFVESIRFENISILHLFKLIVIVFCNSIIQ